MGVIKPNVIKPFLKNSGAGKAAGGKGACKWCAMGECWSHGQVAKGKGKGANDAFRAKGMGKMMGGQGIICHNCGKPGHKSPDCFQGAKGAGKMGGGIICNTCGKPGHKSPDCFQGAKGMMKGFAMQAMSFGGKSKGKGKGLRGFPADKKVWIGGLPADQGSKDFNKQVLEHMKLAGDCKWAEVGKTGSGGAAYATPEEAQNAILMLNGSVFLDHSIEVDVWTKKED